MCHKNAQTQHLYMSSCKFCLSKMSVDLQRSLVEAKSRAYLEEISKEQTWQGDEPALRLLLLPLCREAVLPEYSSQPA